MNYIPSLCQGLKTTSIKFNITLQYANVHVHVHVCKFFNETYFQISAGTKKLQVFKISSNICMNM